MRRNKSNTKGRTVVGSCLLSALLARSRPPKSFSRPRQSPAKINSDFSLAACKRTKCPPFSCIERCTNAEGVSTQFMPEQGGRGNKFEHGELLKMEKTRTVRFSSYWLFARQNRHWSTATFSYIIFPYRPRFVKNWEDIAFLCVYYASVTLRAVPWLAGACCQRCWLGGADLRSPSPVRDNRRPRSTQTSASLPANERNVHLFHVSRGARMQKVLAHNLCLNK